MNEYVIEGWPLGPTSTVYMNGKAVYHIRQYGRQGILASVELHQREAEAIRQVVEERIRAVRVEARAAELEAAAEQFDTRTETLLKTMQNMVGHPDTEPGDVARYGAYSAASQTTAHWLRARAAAIRAGGA